MVGLTIKHFCSLFLEQDQSYIVNSNPQVFLAVSSGMKLSLSFKMFREFVLIQIKTPQLKPILNYSNSCYYISIQMKTCRTSAATRSWHLSSGWKFYRCRASIRITYICSSYYGVALSLSGSPVCTSYERLLRFELGLPRCPQIMKNLDLPAGLL